MFKNNIENAERKLLLKIGLFSQEGAVLAELLEVDS